tara:strand:- start:697 stop:1752 length:1056 start_codon:yes stop_codon:yes gene_type:complete
MKKCLDLAILGLKKTKKNPLVGCVITNNNNIIATGYHKKFGGPHAEVNAINNLIKHHPDNYQELLKKATLYVNLEPCAHHGKTPPCVNLIIKHKIPKVVIGTLDPFQKVNGLSISKLKKNATVITGVLPKECKKINHQYFINHQFKRPFIILKWAESKDGFINDKHPGITKISCKESLISTHKWRSQVDGIMVGTNTVLCDNPKLTTRKHKGKNPIRITIDRHKQLLNKKWNILNSDAKTIIFQETNTKNTKYRKYINYISHNITQKSSDTKKLKHMMHILFEEKVHSILVEGGSTITQNLISQNLWDEARVFYSKKLLQNGIKAPKIKYQDYTQEIKSGTDLLKITHNII